MITFLPKLTAMQFAVLSHIEANNHLAEVRIAFRQWSGITNAAFYATGDRLQRFGFIKKSGGLQDSVVVLTPSGRTAMREYQKHCRECLQSSKLKEEK